MDSVPNEELLREIDGRLHALVKRLYGERMLARGYLTMSEIFWNVREGILDQLLRELPDGVRAQFTVGQLRERAEACIRAEQMGAR